MVVRGRPIARARSVVPVPVRRSGTQRVPECVCVKKYSIYGHVLLDRACIVGPGILVLLEGLLLL